MCLQFFFLLSWISSFSTMCDAHRLVYFTGVRTRWSVNYPKDLLKSDNITVKFWPVNSDLKTCFELPGLNNLQIHFFYLDDVNTFTVTTSTYAGNHLGENLFEFCKMRCCRWIDLVVLSSFTQSTTINKIQIFFDNNYKLILST